MVTESREVPRICRNRLHSRCLSEPQLGTARLASAKRLYQVSVTCSGDTQAPELRMRMGRRDGTGESYKIWSSKTRLYYFFADGTETCKLRDSATIPSSLLRTAALSFPRRASLSLRAWDTVASSSPGVLSRMFSAYSRQAKT